MSPKYENVSSVRISPDDKTIADKLGILADLAGSWRGTGFNLIGRPNFSGGVNIGGPGTNVYLQLSETIETLTVTPIGSAIPNRGFGQNDIELFGLTYLQKISDAANGGALHIEPGIWITQPETTYPAVPTVPPLPPKAQIVARMGTIPHGNSLLAQGTAQPFVGAPVLKGGAANYAFSEFPSFNSTPFPIPPPPALPSINAAGSSELGTKPVPPRFDEYNLNVKTSQTTQRTPFNTNPPLPALPAAINGVPIQTVINDPITLLEAVIKKQVAKGHTFSGTVINISTQVSIQFLTTPDDPTGPTVAVTPLNAAGGIENIPFLNGVAQPAGDGPNAQTATVYATFWIEDVAHPKRPTFRQLQYAQMVVLDFPILLAPAPKPNFGWPHISVATLHKSFS